MKPVVELCVDDLQGVRIAREAGADRAELCDALEVGGLTPSIELVQQAMNEAPAGGLQVIVRSRAGDFVYSDEEITHMCESVSELCDATEAAPVEVGFVVGALTRDGEIDEVAAAAFRWAAQNRPLTFHRAFDEASDQRHGVETLVALGYERILTTGGHPSVAQVDRLRELVEWADGRIAIIASGGVRAHNVAQIVRESGSPEVHMRAPGQHGGTDPEQVRAIMSALSA